MRCPLHESRTLAVPGEGPADASVMLVGEAPGEQEDIRGRPFCGRAGKFFDGLLQRHGLLRENLYITSSVKCRPPGNRNPHREELRTCRELWLERQLGLVGLEMLVLLGRVPVYQVLGLQDKLRNVHGQVFHKGGLQCLVTYHPAAAMRFPQIGKAVEQDFSTLAELAAEPS